jgi:hypothetical protein
VASPAKKVELTMTRIKILGLVIGASLLLFGSAEATPMAPVPLNTVEASTGNFVVQARVHHGLPSALRVATSVTATTERRVVGK